MSKHRKVTMRKYMNYTIGRKQIFGRHARFVIEPGSGDSDPGQLDIDVSGGGSGDNDDQDDDNDTDDITALRQQLAAEKAKADRFKSSIDKLTKEKGDLNKRLHAQMSAEDQLKEEQEERDRRFAEMEKELRTNKYSKRLVGIGMAESDADTFAATIPEIEDSDSFFDTLSKFIKAREKAAADSAIQELLKSRPDINVGNGEGEKEDPAMALAKAAVEASKGRNAAVNADIINKYL